MKFSIKGKWMRLLAAGVSAFIIIFVVVCRELFFADAELEDGAGQALFACAIVLALVTGLFIVIKVQFLPRWEGVIHALVLLLILPLAGFQLVECLNGKLIWDYSNQTFWMNFFLYFTLYVLAYLIAGNFLAAGIAASGFLYIWALANDVLTQFRGKPFVPFDFADAATGFEVADNYTWELTWQSLLGSIIFATILTFCLHLRWPRPKKRFGKIMVRVIPTAYIVAYVLFFYVSSCVTSLGYKPDFWNQARGYRKTGSFFNFMLNTRYLLVTSPSGYDAESVSDIVDAALSEYGVDPDGDVSTNILTGENDYEASDDEDLPNIICIMNEAFSDLEYLSDGKLELNEDNMPFIHSLTENTIKGYTSVSVFGSGTSNSEYEFLSGNSLSFLPAGANVYQLYVKDSEPTLVSQLESLGYSSKAFHPYYASGWNRPSVYEHFGFDDFVSIEDFVDADIIATYKQNNSTIEFDSLLHQYYPEEGQMLLRRFISDSYDFKMLERMYEQHEEDDADTPFFLFNVTMQNHGGYAVDYVNFDQNIEYTNLEGEYDDANRYLSLIQYTDQAFEELVEYFSNVDEPTIILMYGDHLPSLDDDFYEEIFGMSEDEMDIESEQNRYRTPFILWANYDIPSEQINTISTNYLSTLLTQVAGLPQTKYQKYLSVLYQSLPLINAVGYADSEGNYYSSDDETDWSSTINEYSRIEYNSLIDYKNRVSSLFNLDI